MSNSVSPRTWSRVAVIAAVLVAALVAAWIVWRAPRLPAPGSGVYEQTARAFYHGLAALEVGLLDDARTQFARAAGLVADEPAAWANLGLAELRLGELDRAVAPIERALDLAPDHEGVALLAGRMETARGNLERGISHLKRAVELDAGALKARAALAEEIERAGGSEANRDALTLVDELARLAPDNLAVLVDRARLSARVADVRRLDETVTRLAGRSSGWSTQALEQLGVLRAAAADGRFEDAVRATLILRNVLTPLPAFLEGLRAIRTPAELVTDPFDHFIALARPTAAPAAPDRSLTFAVEPMSVAGGVTAMVAFSPDARPASKPLVMAATAGTMELVGAGGPAGAWLFEPAGAVSGSGVVALDWNNDFLTDVAAIRSGELFLVQQGPDGRFLAPVRPALANVGAFSSTGYGVWGADIEMDGDLDMIVGAREGTSPVLRNNADGSWLVVAPFAGIDAARAFAWADLDGDADPDAVFLDALGAIHVLANRQAATFVRVVGVSAPEAVAMAVADLDANGSFDIVTLTASGAVNVTSRRDGVWDTSQVAAWDGFERAGDAREPGNFRLLAADLDNNGGLDLVAAGAGRSRIWLSDERHRLTALLASPEAEVFSIVDLDADGQLDLVATAADKPVRLLGRGTAAYHWKMVRTRAQQQAGDQRINSFGVGGDIQVRSGLLVQKQLLSGMPLHFGLGNQSSIDVARIVWPNGVAQAEFDIGVDDELVAEQRLKGSCPWVFAWDGAGMRFVTDFLWRSPLGLRINAQDTAGVTQTEDWVRIGSEQLAAKDGLYDVRITAELWETHYVDHVSLMAVDHPGDVAVLVDETFLAARPQAHRVQAVAAIRPVRAARDHRGRDVTDLVARQDGRHLAAFELGPYQGIAEDHSVDIEFDEVIPSGGSPVLVARGWVYPTDSSINVAIGQGTGVRPSGVALDLQRANGRWRTVHADLGFPAGKNKTMIIDLRGAAGARRLRLRSNLEVYWDQLTLARIVDAPVRITTVGADRADLRFRGFSTTDSPRGDQPETPRYDRLANVSQRWRDLTGFYTRFGDVRELVDKVDDRYVIMNAGDELRLAFRALPPPPPGWRRDFVLVGDGWEKDGDYNTAFSETVLPLPSHGAPYRATGTSMRLEDDAVYRRHRGDWEQYHTRYVTPQTFVGGLRAGRP